MSRSTRGLVRCAAASVLALAGWGCRVADAKVWNLEQVHEPDGSPSRVGSVQSDFTFQLYRFFRVTNFGSKSWDMTDEKAIEDPLGECLDNVIGLAACNREKPRIRALMVENFSWLAADCSYALSRERCAHELGDLGRRVGVVGPRFLEEDEPPAGPAELGGLLTRLIETSRPALEGLGGDLSTAALAEQCTAVRALTLDLDGARRLLTATNLILVRGGFDEPRLAPLLELHEYLERVCVELALGALMHDSWPRVRAAALLACVRATGNRCPDLLAERMQERAPEVRDAATRALYRFGIPAPPADATPEERAENEELWLSRLIALLGRGGAGPSSVNACRALARLTGRPPTLRPEDWLAWWDGPEYRSGRWGLLGGSV